MDTLKKNSNTGIYTKSRRLPHYSNVDEIQFVTYRIHKSWPRNLLLKCRNAEHVVDTWKENHERNYRLISWVVMPDHVHVLLQTNMDWSLPKIVGSRKSRASFLINQDNRSGGRPVWQKNYFDTYIRNDDHLEHVIQYIWSNPYRSGLVAQDEKYPFWGMIEQTE